MEEKKDILPTEETENNIEEQPKSTLDALLFDDEGDSVPDAEEDETDYESFMAEYRTLINQTLSAAKESTEGTKAEGSSTESGNEASEATVKPEQKKKAAKKKPAKDKPMAAKAESEWDDDITLAPEEYHDADEEKNEAAAMPEEDEPDFDLGESESDDEGRFQLSIDFDGRRPEMPRQEETQERGYDPDKPRAMDWVYDIAEIFVMVLAAVLLLTSFVFKHSVVEGGSMNNTLSDGDHLIISNLFYTPERGDVVVFEDYSTILKKAVVKRIVGLPGETVQVKVDAEGNVRVYINGELLEEDYAFNAKDTNIAQYYEPVTLGDDEVFVMGDNRYHSTDSRNSGVGPIKIDTILGKVLFRFFPFDDFGGIE